MANRFYEKDGSLAPLRGKTIAIVGYGSQGHAHAVNLRDSGLKVVVGLHSGSNSAAKAKAAGLEVLSVADAAKAADTVMVLVPDHIQGEIYRNEIVAGDVNPHYINPKQGLDRLQKLMDEYCGGVTVSYMTNDKLLNIALKKLKVMEEDLESLAAKDIHELLRAWELKHRHRAAECVTQHTLFRKETRWPGYYYRGDAMKVDDANWHVLTVSRRDPKTGEYTMEKAPCYHLVGADE